MDLRDELARQSLLLEFISECVGLEATSGIVRLVTSRLHWICDFDSCSIVFPELPGTAAWTHDRRVGGGGPIQDEALLARHQALLESAKARRAPSLADPAGAALFLVALPLGSRQDDALGALCLARAASSFSHSDLRHLQHACSALGGALTRIAAIHARHESERVTQHSESLLRSAAEDRALLAEQMVGIVSHDLRNPLSAILMGTSVMALGEPLPSQKEKVVQMVRRATLRAQRLVDELLDFTQTRVGKGLTLKLTRVDLDGLLAATIQELKLSFPDMQLEYRGTRLGSASLDEDRLQQLIGNLVANAVAYGSAGRPIRLDCELSDGTLVLSVANEGTPVPGALLATLFEPMVRGTTQGGGDRSVGLGLYIVRAIAEGHGGSVDVTSDAIIGTIFTIRIPAEPPVPPGA